MDHRRSTMVFSLLILWARSSSTRSVPGVHSERGHGKDPGQHRDREGTSFEAMSRYQQQVAGDHREDPAWRPTGSSVGSGGGVTSHEPGADHRQAEPRSERKDSADEIIKRLQPSWLASPHPVLPPESPSINVGGRISKSQYQFSLQSSDWTRSMPG